MISRKHFMEMMGLGFGSMLIKPPKLEGAEMRISDWIARISNGEKLGPTELQQFQEKMDELENKVSYWAQDGEGSLHAKKLWSQDAFFQNMPMSFMVMDKQADTTVPDATFTTIDTYAAYTPVTGDRVTASNDFFELDTTNGRIYIKQTGRVFGFYVYTVWGTSGVGNRAARVYQYHADGTEITYSVAFRIAPPSDGNSSLGTFIFVPWGGTRVVGDYCTLKVYQNSVGDLTLGQCALGAFVLR